MLFNCYKKPLMVLQPGLTGVQEFTSLPTIFQMRRWDLLPPMLIRRKSLQQGPCWYGMTAIGPVLSLLKLP